MQELFLGLAVLGLFLFVGCAAMTIWSHMLRQEKFQTPSLLGLSLIGPATLGCCWKAQVWFRAEDTLFWGRLMSGDAAEVFRLGSVGLIVGSALAMGALSLRKNFLALLFGTVAVGMMYWVVYLHPTPHYVPVPPWQDKLAWFLLLPGGALFSLLVYWQLKPHLTWFRTPAALLSGSLSLISMCSLVSFYGVSHPLNLRPLSSEKRIIAAGCLSCHTMKGRGYPEPGQSLSSVASRQEDTLKAFLRTPTAEKAQELAIRSKPTGEMSGVHLTDQQITLLVDSLKALYDVQPPSMLGPALKEVERILVKHECLACHTYQGEGAVEDNVGGPLEAAREHDRETLVKWLLQPDFINALELGIREEPTGAMTAFALEQEEAERIAEWLLNQTGEPPE